MLWVIEFWVLQVPSTSFLVPATCVLLIFLGSSVLASVSPELLSVVRSFPKPPASPEAYGLQLTPSQKPSSVNSWAEELSPADPTPPTPMVTAFSCCCRPGDVMARLSLSQRTPFLLIFSLTLSWSSCCHPHFHPPAVTTPSLWDALEPPLGVFLLYFSF